MEFKRKYRADRYKSFELARDGDVFPRHFNPFVPNKRISRKQKKWVAKWREIFWGKLMQWNKEGILIVKSKTQSFTDIDNKINRLESN
jgi:hypothetical protein